MSKKFTTVPGGFSGLVPLKQDLERKAELSADVAVMAEPEAKPSVEESHAGVSQEVTEMTPSVEQVASPEHGQDLLAYREKITTALSDYLAGYSALSVVEDINPRVGDYFRAHDPVAVHKTMTQEAKYLSLMLEGLAHGSSLDTDTKEAYQEALDEFIAEAEAAREKMLTDVENIINESIALEKAKKIAATEAYAPNTFPQSFELFSAVLADDVKRGELLSHVNGAIAAYAGLAGELQAEAEVNEGLKKTIQRVGLKRNIDMVLSRQKINVDFIERAQEMNSTPEVLASRFDILKKLMTEIGINTGHLKRWKAHYIKKQPKPKSTVQSPVEESAVVMESHIEEPQSMSTQHVPESTEATAVQSEREMRRAALKNELTELAMEERTLLGQ